MNTATQLINSATKSIEPVSGVAGLEAELILCQVLAISRDELYTQKKIIISKEQEKNFENIVSKRTTGLPLAYITGEKEFFDRNFIVNSNVLIPRPETEMIIDEVKTLAKHLKSPTILDIGTGSGCIAITLAKEIVDSTIIASDIDKEAIEVARLNAKKHGATTQISFIESDLTAKIKDKVDIIVANLPYVLETDKCNSVKKHTISLQFEPQHALYAGNDGLMLYNRLMEELKEKLPKCLILEIDPRQAKEIQNTIVNKLFPKHTETKKDLAGFERLVVATF